MTHGVPVVETYRRPPRLAGALRAVFLAAAFLAGAFVTAFLSAAFLTAVLAAVRLTAFLTAVRLTAFLTAAFLTAFLTAALLTTFLTAALRTAFLTAAFLTALRAPPPAVTPRFTAGPSAGRRCAPETTALNCAPGRNAGTDVGFTFTVSPVRGLRATRAARRRCSKTPKPVMVTLSPL